MTSCKIKKGEKEFELDIQEINKEDGTDDWILVIIEKESGARFIYRLTYELRTQSDYFKGDREDKFKKLAIKLLEEINDLEQIEKYREYKHTISNGDMMTLG